METKQNGYVAFYANKRIELYADSLFHALDMARDKFNPPKSKRHLVHVMLAEKNGDTVIHSTASI